MNVEYVCTRASAICAFEANKSEIMAGYWFSGGNLRERSALFWFWCRQVTLTTIHFIFRHRNFKRRLSLTLFSVFGIESKSSEFRVVLLICCVSVRKKSIEQRDVYKVRVSSHQEFHPCAIVLF